MAQKIRIAVVGASGMVGGLMCRLLQESQIEIEQLFPVASLRSREQKLAFKGSDLSFLTPEEAITLKPDLALFSAGKDAALKYAPQFADVGCTVIDNSSAWRYEESVPLIVPEINGSTLRIDDRIIANPNCSTVQLALALKPMHEAYGLARVVVSTYQSVSGAGKSAMDQMRKEREGEYVQDMVLKHPIDQNVIPHIDEFQENGYTREEMKMVWESRKILGIPDLRFTSTCVRVPVQVSHSESVNVEFKSKPDVSKIRKMLENTSGVLVLDDPFNLEYPMPLDAAGRDEVFVGRIREDNSHENAINFWVVSDNLRKGAATNALQIAEYLYERGML